MCGIIARIGDGEAVDELLTGLKNLEYRGYDSAGVAIRNGTGIAVRKQAGTVDGLREVVEGDEPRGGVGIGHTRWSTHGPPTDANAHPHLDCTGSIAVVHNGIIGNHDQIRSELIARGHEFESETDTEVVPHLIEESIAGGATPEEAFRTAVERLEGSYALVATVAGEPALFATRHGSPLVLGIDGDRRFLASDVPAFLEFTEQVVYLEDDDVVVLDGDGYRITDEGGHPVDHPVETVDWSAADAEKGSYEHFMFKEINEQPEALGQTVSDRFTPSGELDLDLDRDLLDGVDHVHFVACGTSYHAGLVGTTLLRNADVPSTTHRASEFVVTPAPLNADSLVVGVTQSGETADTLEALRRARDRGARTLAVTNAPGSTVVRETDDAIFIRAGPEIGVAATKTFSSQVATLVLLSEMLTRTLTGEGTEDFSDVAESLTSLPGDVQTVLDTSRARRVAEFYAGSEAQFFIGRAGAYPIALEGALKFKEITYEHAEGFAAGELKHGPLALVNTDTPVFAIVLGPGDEKTIGNIREVQARGAPVIAVAPEHATDVLDVADERLTVPETHPVVAPILANVQLQLVSYHVAELLSRSIDKPRNLAKSVTVE
ncbi:MAG: glutamine--fructose-6-phosphate transaminase (isomerizing) [Halanaeroarchaeum sp.]